MVKATPGPRVLRFKQLGLYGIHHSRHHLESMRRKGAFPAPIEIYGRKVGWLEADIVEWLQKDENARKEAATPIDILKDLVDAIWRVRDEMDESHIRMITPLAGANLDLHLHRATRALNRAGLKVAWTDSMGKPR